MSLATSTVDLGKSFRLWKLIQQLQTSCDDSLIGSAIKICIAERELWENIVEVIGFYAVRNPKYIEAIIGTKALELYNNLNNK